MTAGTIFEKTRTSLRVWLAGAWYVTNQKQGVNALGLQRVLGLGSYQTAWAILHRFRQAMVRPGRERLKGLVEVDETYLAITDRQAPTSTKKRKSNDAYRSQLRSIFRYCELWGLRDSGSNPVDAIPTKGYRRRKRYITDSHLRRIKIAGLYGDDGRVNPSGMVFCCITELLYLTGADVSVVVRIREKADPGQPDEPHICDEGIFLRRDKTDGTSRPLIIEWTPRLRAVVARLHALKVTRRGHKRMAKRVETPCLITKVDGSPMNYEAYSNSWQKAMKRAMATGKVPPTMIRDLRAKAGTDKDEDEGIAAANTMLDHTTQAQTADYIRRKKLRKVKAVK